MNEGVKLNKLNFVATQCSVSGPFENSAYFLPSHWPIFKCALIKNDLKLKNLKLFKYGILQMMKNVIPMKFFNLQNIHKMASLKISVLEDFNSDQLETRIELKHPIKSFLAQ